MPGLTESQMITLMNTTLSKFIKDKFIAVQKLQSYPACEKFVLTTKQGVSIDSHNLEWEVRLLSNTGSFRGVNFHEAWQAVEGPAPVRAKAPVIKYEGKGIVFDQREKTMNQGSGQIVDLMRVKTDGFFEEVFNTLEADIFAIPLTLADAVHLWGLPRWARPSMDSSGVFVTDTVGGFNGTYIRSADGATGQATLANIDASNVLYERWRNWCFTHGGAMTFAVAEACRRASNFTKFRAYPKKIGETTMGMVSIFLCQSFHESYLTLVNQGPDDRGTGGQTADLFPYQDGTINGVNIMRTPQLDFDATLPIYGVRHDACYIARLPGFWFKQGNFREMPNAHNSLYAPMDVCGNLICMSPKESVWVGHGSF